MKSEENGNNNFVNSNDIELSLMDHSYVAQKTLRNSAQLIKPKRTISTIVVQWSAAHYISLNFNKMFEKNVNVQLLV